MNNQKQYSFEKNAKEPVFTFTGDEFGALNNMLMHYANQPSYVLYDRIMSLTGMKFDQYLKEGLIEEKEIPPVAE